MTAPTPKDHSVLPQGWSWSDVGHGALDIVGLVPGYGEAADVANAAWYARDGQYLEAGLSLISCVPIVGDAIGKGGKLAKKSGGSALKKLAPLIKKMDFSKVLAPFRKNKKLGPHVDKMVEALSKWRNDIVSKVQGKTSCPKAALAAKKSVAEQIVKNNDFATPVNKSVFYSGPGNREMALNFARDGGVPIDDTVGGSLLNGENLYSEFGKQSHEADAIWAQASEKFANAASGDVTAFVRGASPSRVFGNVELPLLLKNEKVTSINGVPRKFLVHLENESPGAAFTAVVGNAPN